ncbi:hypothetical protein C9439_01600 [archaeon SCG-AAA382B04]|nr:hypothetical protein C9439_01600 [archaeon SCG-AAA382B04]
MSNTYLEEGEHKREELVEEIDHGVLLKGSRGGQVSTAEGEFQFNAEEGYLIENGEIQKHIKDVSLTGNTLNVLKNIEKLSETKSFYPGRCGKGGQMVPVADGAPYTKISNALVGGESDF